LALFREGTGFRKVILVCGRTDLRKGASGLAAVIEYHYGMNSLEEGTLFLFCGNNRSVIKGLLFEGDGYLVMTKRLSCGFFQWPRTSTEARQIDIDAFRRLMDGFQVDSSIRNTERIQQNM
jgi:transposase